MKKQRRKRAAGAGPDSDSVTGMIAPMRELVEQNKELYVERHEYRDATAADFNGLDRNWYDAAASGRCSGRIAGICIC